GSTIDVRGAWVNDDPAISHGALAPLFTTGGNVTLASSGSLAVPAGMLVDVSGGAQRTAAGGLVSGAGGTIAITQATGLIPSSAAGLKDLTLTLGAQLRGFALNAGGKLSLTIPTLCVSGVKCADTHAVRVDPDLFTDFGFGSVSLT